MQGLASRRVYLTLEPALRPIVRRMSATQATGLAGRALGTADWHGLASASKTSDS